MRPIRLALGSFQVLTDAKLKQKPKLLTATSPTVSDIKPAYRMKFTGSTRTPALIITASTDLTAHTDSLRS